jgi:hypothetical protein
MFVLQMCLLVLMHHQSCSLHLAIQRSARFVLPSMLSSYPALPHLHSTEHFTAQHHPCPHPACLERKFVVFTEEAELKRHFATEHGGEMNLSRAQRRNLLTVNIQLNYAREQEEAAAAALARPGVVIGGGHNLPRRGGGMRHSRSEGAMAAALAASLESNQVENVMRRSAAEAGAGDPGSVTFNADDFPTVSGQGSGAAPLGTWVGASGGKASANKWCRVRLQ